MEFFDWINIVQTFMQYFYNPSLTGSLEEKLAQIVDVNLLVQYIGIGVAAGLFVLCLIMGGIGMHVMAKRAGIGGSWMGFVPFLNTWYAGKLAGETTVFRTKMKRPGLWAMLLEVVYVLLNVFSIVIWFLLMREEYFAGSYNDKGELTGFYLNAAQIPLALRWIVDAQIAVQVCISVSRLALIFFFCLLFFAFFRKYYARSPFLMTFLCAIFPLRGFVIFAVRNNAPVDYDAYVRRQMEEFRRRQAGQYGGPGGFGADVSRGGDDPFSDFGGSGGAPASSSGDDPFPDFGGSDDGGTSSGSS